MVQEIVERGDAAHLLEVPQHLRRHTCVPDTEPFENVVLAFREQAGVELLPRIGCSRISKLAFACRPVEGGATDPGWTERRWVPLAPRTLKRLEAITKGVKARCGLNLEPMQLAALLLEKTTEQLNEDEVADLVGPGHA